MGIKELFRQFIFSVFAVLCAAVLLCGITAVREKTQYNMDMTEYDRLEISKSDGGFIISAGERELVIDYADGINFEIQN